MKASQVKILPSAAIATYHDRFRAEVFVATTAGRKRELVTIEFFERRPDWARLEKLKEANWHLDVPEGQRLFAASAGHRRDPLNMFWVGWRDPQTIFALSLFQENPITVRLDPGDRLVDPPVTVSDRRMHQYFLRGEASAPQLMRHEFSGELNAPGVHDTRQLANIGTPVGVIGVAPIPEHPEGGTLVAWFQHGAEGGRVGFARIIREAAQVVLSDPIPGVRAFSNSRPGIFTGPEGPATAAFIVESTVIPACTIVEAVCDFDKATCETNIQKLAVGRDDLHAGASFYL